MKFLTFFIIFWAIVGFSWNSLNIDLPKTKLWQGAEIVVLAPVIAWHWTKVAINIILEKLNAKKD